MYKPVKDTGDALPVPQLLFSRLAAPGASEPRFRVALYVLSAGGATAEDTAAALGLKRSEVERALSYWEGAGLLQREGQAAAMAAEMPAAQAKQKRLTTAETVRAGEADPTLGFMLKELQRVYGTVIGPKPTSVFASLYVQEGYPAELILMAASYAAGRGVTSAAYVESVLAGWRRNGIHTSADADLHLRLMDEREAREKELAEMMGLAWDPFTLAEKRKIALWYEEYGYGPEMIETARLAAGEKRNEVKYLAGILKKWHAKGYKSPRDVQTDGGGSNLRVQSARSAAAMQDDMLAVVDYVPMKRRTE